MIILSSYRDNQISIMTKNGSIAELSCTIPIEEIEGSTFYFHRIKVKGEFEGTGEGKELMIEVCRYMDQLNATIYNELNPYGKRDLKSLKSFFRASGFIMFKEPNTMIRRPRSKECPYIFEEEIHTLRRYNPKYGDDRICECGHPYHRHFDTYEDFACCGYKYCSCFEFVEK